MHKKIEHFKEIQRDEVADELAPLYDKGFSSIRPIFRANDDERINAFIEERKSKLKVISSDSQYEEDFDDFEELLGDDEYASLINEEGEIQVADSIYKYTDKGLYFVHESDVDYLHTYLEEQMLLKNMEDPCSGGVTEVDERINLFRDPVEDCSSGGGSYSPPPSPPPPFDVNSFIANLPECTKRSSILSFILGPSVSCTENFDSRHRVKTKYWNQNYLIYRSIGVVVKHQTKSVWIWWTSKTDEIRLGIYQAYFEYTLPAPNYNNIIPKVFIYDGNAYNSEAKFLGTAIDKSLPELPFEADLEIVFDLEPYGLDEYSISSEKINKLFWETAWKEGKNVLQRLGKSMPDKISFVGIAGQKFVVNYVNKSFQETNVKKISKVFDWQVAFGIKLGTSINGGFTFKGVKLPNLYDYKKINMDIYGVAREGNTWKGSRLVYKK